jgi:signal transduction histidine kinase
MEHVRLHGGAVRVENRPVRGARFVVDLPVEP